MVFLFLSTHSLLAPQSLNLKWLRSGFDPPPLASSTPPAILSCYTMLFCKWLRARGLRENDHSSSSDAFSVKVSSWTITLPRDARSRSYWFGARRSWNGLGEFPRFLRIAHPKPHPRSRPRTWASISFGRLRYEHALPRRSSGTVL